MLSVIFSWIVFGFLVWLLARLLLPGARTLGFFGTSTLGVVGAFVGASVASLLGGSPMFELHSSGILGSIVGAVAILGLADVASRDSRI